MDDLDDLVLNPSLRINADWQVRRKDQPIGQFRLVSPLQVPLLRVVLQVLEGNDLGSLLAVGVPRSLIDAIIEQGILVRKDQLPAAAEAFQCVPDSALVEMVPAELLARYRQLAEEELELNPRRFVQTDGRVPEPMRGQLILGTELWQHLGRAEAWLGSFAADLPVLWTEHPVSGVWEPTWIAGVFSEELRAVILDGADPRALAPACRLALTLAHVLVPKAQPDGDRRVSEGLAELARELRERRYVVLTDLLSPLHIAAARRYFRALRREGFFELDRDQVIGMRDGVYCEAWCMYLQSQLARTINRIVPEAVEPSYTWVRRYRPGASLPRHTDRPQCRWNASLCIDVDPDVARAAAWPIKMEVEGVVSEARLGMGDAVLYSGTEIPHWREPLAPGNAVTMCFLHYVPTDFTGPRA